MKKIDKIKEEHIMGYIKYLIERGKYTVSTNENSKTANSAKNRQDYSENLSKGTINNYIRNIRVFFNYMYNNGKIEKNPISRVQPIKCKRLAVDYIDDTDMRRLLENFDLSKFSEYRDYIITLLIFDTGMRIGETLLIKEEDIDFNEKTILLLADNTKGKRDRYVFFSSKMQSNLQKWIKYRNKYVKSNFLFCKADGGKLTINNYEKNFKKYGKRIGMENIHPHMLRNNFAKRFLMSGGDIYVLSKILGHSSIKVTETCYLDLQTADLKRQYQKYSPLMQLDRNL